MLYLIYDKDTKQVVKSTVTEPTEINDSFDVVIDRSEGFKEGVEIEKLIIIHDYMIENDIKYLTNYSAMKQSAKAQEIISRMQQMQLENDTLKLKLEQSEADNLTTLEALAEVYEMLLAMQA